jgi:hypothetical protein
VHRPPSWPQLQQPRRHRGDQPVQLGTQRGGLASQQLDALRRGAQRPDGHAVLQRAGRPIPQQGAAGDLPLGGQPVKLRPQLLGRAHDQRLELVDRADLGHARAVPGGQQHSQRLPIPERSGSLPC